MAPVGVVDFVGMSSSELLSHFGFFTSLDDLRRTTPVDILRIRAGLHYDLEFHEPTDFDHISTRRKLRLPDKDFRALTLYEMEGYPHLFKGQTGPSCLGCNGEIVLPLDLRRSHGANLHAACYAQGVNERVNEGFDVGRLLTTRNPDMLQYHLRNAFDNHPSEFHGDEPAILTRRDLENHEIRTREQLERFYWEGITPEMDR